MRQNPKVYPNLVVERFHQIPQSVPKNTIAFMGEPGFRDQNPFTVPTWQPAPLNLEPPSRFPWLSRYLRTGGGRGCASFPWWPRIMHSILTLTPLALSFVPSLFSQSNKKNIPITMWHLKAATCHSKDNMFNCGTLTSTMAEGNPKE